MSSTPAPRGRAAGRERLVGVDVARGVAVAGMVTAHVLSRDATGAAGAAFELASGRSSALFAVLAGVSLGLLTRRGLAPAGPRVRAGLRAAVAVRAVLVGLLGLWLAGRHPPVAVILAHYALAQLLLLPALWWPPRVLAVLAALWLPLAPVAAFVLREGPPDPGEQPDLGVLGTPLVLLRTLLLTGYYPVLGWLGYLLLGLAISRCDLRSRRTALRLAGAGAVLAAAAALTSLVLLGPAGGGAALRAADGAWVAWTAANGFYGTTPTSSWWWLAVAEAHAGTPADLVGTAGSALLVL
ncbi:heparan-alpha-glucosaminide N-acetyltransferase domain-containing protein, partial [Kineococcus glutinatus]|uniref:heparan-alpha-glucosaminide N-acetyltransferase domain-containing protein n=1 Tax=Kineococcus glutinatus TaxID=1070872 RepID=UPI0031ECA821